VNRAGRSGERPANSRHAMRFWHKVRHETKALALATLFFGTWIGALMVVKTLALAEYKIEFHGLSLALVGTLVLAKAVLVLEHFPLGAGIGRQPAWVEVIVRTAVYGVGVFVLLLFEKAFLLPLPEAAAESAESPVVKTPKTLLRTCRKEHEHS
jgi:hypothetical protein